MRHVMVTCFLDLSFGPPTTALTFLMFFLCPSIFIFWQDVRAQLMQLCARLGIPATTTCGGDRDLILKSFLSGFFQNTALLQPDGKYKSVLGGRAVGIHPTSGLFTKKVNAIM